MCNLYTNKATREEIAALFGETLRWRRELHEMPGNYAAEVYPGYTGLVFAENRLQAMNWGFPLPQVSKKTGKPIKPKPVNNARTDKLHTQFWKASFESRRCLIPLTAFAEAEGEYGSMTRTWISLPDQPVFCCAGIWRWSEEWGAVYSMVMTEPCEATACVHDRMPVILRPGDYATWQGGATAEAFGLCVPYAGAVTIERTGEPWVARRMG